MQIELKSNRQIIYGYSFTGAILFSIFLITEYIKYYPYYPEVLAYLLFMTAADLLFFAPGLIALFKKRPTYIFTENEIIVDKKNFKGTIKMADIESMRYQESTGHYLVLTLLCGDMALHIKEKNGQIHHLGYISNRDAKRLKEFLYKDLLEFYTRRRKQGVNHD